MEMYAGVWIKDTCTLPQLAGIRLKQPKASSLCSYTKPMIINTDLQHMLMQNEPRTGGVFERKQLLCVNQSTVLM